MSHPEETTLDGHVADVFAHRFVVRTATGRVLADLGPKGAEGISLREGEAVTLWGEMKPSELKVTRIAKAGGAPVPVPHRTPSHDKPAGADPRPAVKTAEDHGFTVIGAPRRKPKHFELLGRDKAGALVELHVELDGRLRETKVVEGGEPRRADDTAA